MMNPLAFIAMLEEVLKLFSELKADGTIDRLVAAEQAIAHEVENNAVLKDLLGKIEALNAKK